MTSMLQNLDSGLKIIWSLALFIIAIIGGMWVYNLWKGRKADALNEISFEGKKISINVDSTPLDKLVDESNREHCASESSGEDTPKK